MLYSPIVECSKTRSCKYSEKFFSPVGLILFTNTASPITNHQPLDVATHSPRKSTKSDFFLDQLILISDGMVTKTTSFYIHVEIGGL